MWSNRIGVAAKLREAIRSLPIRIERVTTSQLRLDTGSMQRTSTIVELHGDGHIGRGEDIAYSPETQQRLPQMFEQRAADLAGSWTIEQLTAHLDETGVTVAGGDAWDDKPGYHRWALEAAALDLALRQAGTDLHGLLGFLDAEPLTVSLSMGLGDPPAVDVLERWLALDPSITFKIDVSMTWHHELVEQLARLGPAVATIDFKALYSGDWINNDYPTTLYGSIGATLPHALLEDARINAETFDAFDEDALGRLAWDYPITAPADVPGLPGATATFADLIPGAINIKPSRFGSLEDLLGTIALCDQHGIPCYSGGQFELGYGRTQVQAIASLCFPDGPNDCAPVMFHGATPETPDLPLGPVSIPRGIGYGWDAPTPAVPL